jgi:glycosyltransferase involved in cell wall biosynthesis
VILKPSRDGTEEVIKKYKRILNIKLVLQKEGYVTDALNLGLKHAEGDVIAFLDDDAIPCVDWVQRYIESYERLDNVGGVAGNVIPAYFEEGKFTKVDGISHVIPSVRPSSFLESVFCKVWNRPLEGLEDYLVYISKAGVVEKNPSISNLAWHRPVKSLLGIGANMSVLSEAVKGFKFPNSWILGLAWEQFLGWHLWKKGYDLLFDPKAYIYHLIHGETLTRNVGNTKKDFLRWAENYLLFYRLYGWEPKLSAMYRIAWLIFLSLIDLKNVCRDKEYDSIVRLGGRYYSELTGLKMLLSRKISGCYTPRSDLEKIRGRGV